MPVAVELTYEQEEKRLLTEVIGEYNANNDARKTSVSNELTWDMVRWYPIREPNSYPRAIRVVTVGSNPVRVAHISKKDTEKWASWQPVLQEWYRRKQTEKRINHKELTKGEI